MTSRYGVEGRVVKPDPNIKHDDTITQADAARLLGVTSATLSQALDRGRFTVVWDLESRRRLLLRQEVEVADRGDEAAPGAWREMPEVSECEKRQEGE